MLPDSKGHVIYSIIAQSYSIKLMHVPHIVGIKAIRVQYVATQKMRFLIRQTHTPCIIVGKLEPDTTQFL